MLMFTAVIYIITFFFVGIVLRGFLQSSMRRTDDKGEGEKKGRQQAGKCPVTCSLRDGGVSAV